MTDCAFHRAMEYFSKGQKSDSITTSEDIAKRPKTSKTTGFIGVNNYNFLLTQVQSNLAKLPPLPADATTAKQDVSDLFDRLIVYSNKFDPAHQIESCTSVGQKTISNALIDIQAEQTDVLKLSEKYFETMSKETAGDVKVIGTMITKEILNLENFWFNYGSAQNYIDELNIPEDRSAFTKSINDYKILIKDNFQGKGFFDFFN